MRTHLHRAWMLAALLIGVGLVVSLRGQFIFRVPPPASGSLSVPVTTQEALYGGSTAGVARADDPVRVGIPLPDSAITGTDDVNDLTITGAGAAVGQFRALGHWPSGRIKWLLVDTVADLSAGGSDTFTVTSGGSGNFGGSNLATDNGATISVDTGPCQFTIKEANFNGFDIVVCNGTTIVATGASTGLVVMGPANPGTTCGTCTTPYTSANDASSTVTIEENGPVTTVLKASGAYKDGSGNVYLRFTVRLYFYKGLSRVKAVTTLRNADLGASGSFATAYKGMAANEWRLTANIAGTRSYTIAKEAAAAVETGTMSGSDDIYLYQGATVRMQHDDWCGSGCVAYTADSGWELEKNGANVDSGDNSAAQAVGGWADIRNAAGVGVSIGVYQMAAYWPKSLEFASGGSDVRIGIWPRQNSRTYHQAWPQWSTHDLYFNFHDTALSAPGDEFLKFQHALIGRADYTHYNTAAVFPWSIVNPTTEENYYEATGAAGVPTIMAASAWPYTDHGTSNSELFIHRFRAWAQGGGANQIEFRWSWLINYLQRGMTGRYLHAAHFYRFQTDDVFPHSDGFRWRDQMSGLNTANGFPTATSTNDTGAHRTWIDAQHRHWSGMTDFYFLTGDELVKEALLDGPLDSYTTPDTYGTNLALMGASREVGAQLQGASRLYTFLVAIGESAEATTVINYATTIYEEQVKAPELCAESDDTYLGCTPNPPTWQPDGAFDGVSPLRGVHWAGGGYGSWCGGAVFQRGTGPLQQGILVIGILEFRHVKGSGWADYWPSLDLAYGIARGAIAETYYDDNSGEHDQEGWVPASLIDQASDCTAPATEDDRYPPPPYQSTTWAIFQVLAMVEGDLSNWEDKFQIALQRAMYATGGGFDENGSYLISAVIDAHSRGTTTLEDVTITSFVDNGGGSYTIGWVVPSGAQSYRIKSSTHTITDWMNFNAGNFTYGNTPTTYRPWFSATPHTAPSPATAGTTQTTTITGLGTGLTAVNFSVRAYVTPAAASLSLVWSTQTTSGDGSNWVTQTKHVYDAISGAGIIALTRTGSASIYVTDLFSYLSSTLVFDRIGGTGHTSNTCTVGTGADSDLDPWQVDHHYEGQVAIDTSRGHYYQFGGLCAPLDFTDVFRMDLNADPDTNTTEILTPATTPTLTYSGSWAYVPRNDVFVFHAGTSPRTWVFCPDPENNGLSAAQTAAGCDTREDFQLVFTGASGTDPPQSYYSQIEDDPATNRVLMFSWYCEASCGSSNLLVYAFDLENAAGGWDDLGASNPPSNQSVTGHEILIARITSGPYSGKFHYHRTSHRNADDNQGCDAVLTTTGTPAWTTCTVNTGTGPEKWAHEYFDPTIGTKGGLVAIETPGAGGNPPVVWHGVIQ